MSNDLLLPSSGAVISPWSEERPIRDTQEDVAAPDPEAVIADTPNRASRLVQLAGEAELFHTLGGEPFARVAVAAHHETWPLHSKSFRRWLVRRFYHAEKCAPSASASRARGERGGAAPLSESGHGR